MDSEETRLPTPALARLELAVAVLFTVGAAGLSIFMPLFVETGGLRAAQTFVHLTPVFFPRLAFGVMAALGVIHVVRAYGQLSATAPPDEKKWTEKYRNVILIAALVFLYAWLLPSLGFTAATFVAIAGVTITIGSRKWWEILPISLLTPLVVRFVFERLLLIALPRSDFDFIAVPEEALMQFLVRLFFLRF